MEHLRKLSCTCCPGAAFALAAASLLGASLAAPHSAPALQAAPATAPAAATPLLDEPEVSPAVLSGNETITITLPENFPLSTSRLQVAVFEAGRPNRVADIRRDFKITDGRLRATLAVQAEPGRYELRLVSGDKARTPISRPAAFVVSGLQRRAGWWLLNGSPFAADSSSGVPAAADTIAAPSPALPFFFTGLKRETGRKPKPASAISAQGGPVAWKTWELPALTGMLAPGYDFGALQTNLRKSLAEASARGERGYLGFALPAATSMPEGDGEVDGAAVARAVASLRAMLEQLQPGSALLLQIHTPLSRADDTTLADAAGPLCDGIVIRTVLGDRPNALWTVKVARRIAEEQPGYDLPIFVGLTAHSGVHSSLVFDTDDLQLDLWMAGATGLLSNAPEPPVWAGAIARNLPLFVGSVTLEDIGILPGGDPLPLYHDLRRVRRIPLLARLTAAGRGSVVSESFAVRLEEGISKSRIEQLRQAASGGARIYLEGAPLKDINGREVPWQLGSLVGAEAKALSPAPGFTTMTLEDGWMFGTGRGLRVPVRQSVAVTVNKGTVAGQAKQERGRDRLTEPRVAARLTDGSPALIINPVGKGEVVWMPHQPIRSSPPRTGPTPPATGKAPSTGPDGRPLNVDYLPPHLRYYASVAGYLQPALVHVKGNDPGQAGAESVRVALRRSARGAHIVALFNDADRPADVTASLDSGATVALDLLNEKEVPVEARGFSTEARLTLPARGYALLAFAESRRALDDERNAPLAPVRLK